VIYLDASSGIVTLLDRSDVLRDTGGGISESDSAFRVRVLIKFEGNAELPLEMDAALGS
jgi:hypothetical protein